MYLSELKLWNFRKYGGNSFELDKPHLSVPFKQGLNVLVGENDSGKSAILDAIKIALRTHAIEWIRVEESDFYNNSSRLRIELIFRDLNNEEAKNFIEWLGWEEITIHTDEKSEIKQTPILRLIYQVEYKNSRIIPTDISAGMDDFGSALNAEAKEYLKITYLKALRDADNELIAKKNSRLSQILKGHHLFKETPVNKHELTSQLIGFNDGVKKWFENQTPNPNGKSNNDEIKKIIDDFIGAFIDQEDSSTFIISDANIASILEKITLGLSNIPNPGLGTLNRLYMAAELLHLKRDWDGLKLCLIEELEAHLHPQAQMKIIEKLQGEKDVQFILTTHSPNLASKVNIENLILCHSSNAYSLDIGKTRLDKADYRYLKRFLDVTKSNLFFAKGIIIVEGWTEEILIPVLAKKIGCDLTQNEVSVVNVGSTAYLHFARIFLRNDSSQKLDIPVSIVSDLDVRPDETNNQFNNTEEESKRMSIKENFNSFDGSTIQLFVAKQWTLEWCIYKSSISDIFKDIIAKVHSETVEFKRDEYGNYTTDFEIKLINKLKKSKGNSGVDKVKVATELAELLDDTSILIKQSDNYLMYLVDAIKHACNANENKG